MDVLENGPSSALRRASSTSTGTPSRRELPDKVLLPVLRRPVRRGAGGGAARSSSSRDGAFFLRYYEHRLPIAPAHLPRDPRPPRSTSCARLGAEHAQLQELRSILTALAPPARARRADPARVAERAAREGGRQAAARRAASQESPEIARPSSTTTSRLFNGTPGDPRSFDPSTRCSTRRRTGWPYWRVAGEEINYRRFFDINDLAAIRMERPEVFDGDPRAGPPPGRRGQGRPACASTIPTGSTRPASTSGGCRRAPLATARRLRPELARERRWPLAAHYRPRSRRTRPTPARPLWIVAEKILAPGRAAARVVGGGAAPPATTSRVGQRPLRRPRHRAADRPRSTRASRAPTPSFGRRDAMRPSG